MRGIRFIVIFILVQLHSNFALAQSSVNPEITPQLSHIYGTGISKLHPNGRWLATGSADHTIKLWDIYEGKLIRTFYGHEGTILSLDFHPNPDSLLMMSTAEEDNYLITWELVNGTMHRKVKLPDNFSLESVAFDARTQGELYYLFGYRGFRVCKTATGSTFQTTNLPESLIDGDAHAGEKIDGLYGLDKMMTSGRLKYLNGEDKIMLRYYTKLYLVDHVQNVDSLDCEHEIIQTSYNAKSRRLAVATAKSLMVWDLKTKRQIFKWNHKQSSTPYFVISENGDLVLIKISIQENIIFNIKTNKSVQVFQGLDYSFAAFVQDDQYLLTCGQEGKPRIFEIASLEERKIPTFYNSIERIALSPDKKWMVVADGNKSLKIINRTTLKVDKELTGFYGTIQSIAFSEDGKYLATGGADLMVRVFDTRNFTLLKKFQVLDPENNALGNNGLYSLDNLIFDKNSTYIYTGIHSKQTMVITTAKVYKYDWKEAKRMATSKGFDSWIGKMAYHPSSNTLAVISTDKLRLLKTSDLSISKKIKEDVVFYDNVIFSENGKYLLATAWGKVMIWQYPSMKKINTFDINLGYAWALKFINDSMIAVAGGFDHFDQLFININSGNVIKRLQGHSNRVLDACIDGSTYITSSLDGKIIFWDLNQYNLLATMMLPRGKEDFIIYNPDGYYMASKGALDYMNITHQMQMFDINIFDLEKNRPDILLRQIGKSSEELAEFYHKLYLKRKANSPGAPVWISEDIPTIERSIIPFHTAESNISLRIKAGSSQTPLTGLNIWVNGVPVYTKNGMHFSAPLKTLDTAITVFLQTGNNIIEYMVVNSAGMQSERPKLSIRCDHKFRQSDLYIVCLSVSRYKDARYNLKYAVKDGRDMATLLSEGMLVTGEKDSLSQYYDHVFVDTLFDDNATLEQFLAVERKLMQATPHDRVIVYLSGHGLLDEKLDFWFAMHDIDFKNPDRGGLSYRQLENLLDKIPAREKLLLMDACHSGQPDKSQVAELANSNLQNARAVASYTYRGTEIENEDKPDLNASFELMQQVFRDFNLGSGTQVISAAAGNSYALESDEWNNGIFTYCLLNGIKNKYADMDEDGEIKLSELQEYVSTQVSQQTAGRQKPTGRSWNKWADFRIN